jgi:hypothetical protein
MDVKSGEAVSVLPDEPLDTAGPARRTFPPRPGHLAVVSTAPRLPPVTTVVEYGRRNGAA